MRVASTYASTGEKGVPLQRLRPVIDELRREFATPYPLATAKPYVLGKELVLDLQERNGIPRAIAIVIRSGLLADDAQRFFKKVEFDPPGEGDVRLLRPVRMASIEQIADGYELPTEEIRTAIAYEEQLRSPAS